MEPGFKVDPIGLYIGYFISKDDDKDSKKKVIKQIIKKDEKYMDISNNCLLYIF